MVFHINKEIDRIDRESNGIVGKSNGAVTRTK